MKKILLVLLFVFVVFCSCSMPLCTNLYTLISNHKLWMNPDLSTFTTYSEIANYLESQIEYKSESVNVWSDPEITLNRGYGDCEDYALAFMNTAYLSMGIKMELVFVNYCNLLCLDGVDLSKCNLDSQIPEKIEGEFDYVMLRYNGVLISPVSSSIFTGLVYHSFSFDEVFDY